MNRNISEKSASNIPSFKLFQTKYLDRTIPFPVCARAHRHMSSYRKVAGQYIYTLQSPNLKTFKEPGIDSKDLLGQNAGDG